MKERDLFIAEVKRLMHELGYGDHPRFIDTTKDSVLIRYDWLVPVMDGERVKIVDGEIQTASRAIYITMSGRELSASKAPIKLLAKGRVRVALGLLWDEVLLDELAAA